MKSIKHILSLCGILLSVTACEKDVDFKSKESGPKMVVNSIINCAENNHTIKISESVFLFGDKNPEAVKDATIKLQVNGENVPLTFQYEENSHRYYEFNAQLASGDKLEISGESPKHGKIHAIDHIPYPATIKEVKTEWFTSNKDSRSYLRTLITLRDKPEEKNYYRVIIRSKEIYGYNNSDTEEWVRQHVFVDQEILFNNISGVLGEDEDAHKYRIFPDALFDGSEYTLNVYIAMDQNNPWGRIDERFIKVEIHTISENMYKYLRSLELSMSEDNFSEPVKIYSNIENGYGVLGSYNVAEMIINL